jgi:hypothetical protein
MRHHSLTPVGICHRKWLIIVILLLLYTVDDMAERIGEMSALATLMYASAPIQKSICTGSVNRSRGLSSQCTLENLGPCLQQFPTLWKTLFSAFVGQDAYGCLNYSPANGNQQKTLRPSVQIVEALLLRCYPHIISFAKKRNIYFFSVWKIINF